MPTVYVDSNVFIAVINQDFGRAFEFMDYKSQEFFDKVISCHYEIVISDAVIFEIKKATMFSDKDIAELLDKFSNKLTVIHPDNVLKAEAVKMNRKIRTGYMDCLHYLLSKKYECIVTWNIKHFPNGKKPTEM